MGYDEQRFPMEMKLEAITVTQAASVSDLIDLEESLRTEAEAEGCRWAFRGQPKDYGTLVPSFQREFSRQSYGTAEVIERKLIDAFRTHYSRLQDRSADMPAPDQIAVGYDLRCLSVMQHYEIPTRLLDWTSDYWTAVYFACTSHPDRTAELWIYDRRIFDEGRSADPSLASLLDRSRYPPLEPALLSRRGEKLIVELDPSITPRMERQFAHHTVSANVFADHAPLLYEEQTKAPGLPDPPNMLRRILVDAACKGKALQYMAEYKDITASTVFPDVVGLGRYLRWQFESLRTMLL